MAAKVVLFGAGATGRGHVGLLVWQAGAELVLVDKKPELVKALQENSTYTVRLFGEPGEEVKVTGFRVYHADLRLAIAQEIIDAQAVLTAVFDQNLADVAQTLALAVRACRLEGRSTPINVIACENMMDSSSTLGNHVRKLLKGEDLDYCHDLWGFPDCMISRVVPQPEADPLHIVTENYNEWTARREAFNGEKQMVLRALELVDNQTARLERKLFIHNGGHAVCGYIGHQRGHQYIHQAVHDPVVAQHVLGALDELGEVVRVKHGFSKESIKEYEQDLVRRGSIAEMKDEIRRVIRDPLRKLSSRERLVAPALLAVEYGLPRSWIVKGIVAAWRNYYLEYEPETLTLPENEFMGRFQDKLNETSGLSKEHPLTVEIMSEWKNEGK
jgi:mannitol-1-phosphate 5-dehydrogenase